MVSFGHSAVGVMVGSAAYNFLGQGNLIEGLVITGGAGVISHYIMDTFPHGHFSMPGGYKKGILKIIIFDLFLSVILFLGLTYFKFGFSENFLYILFGIGGSQLPDVVDGLIYTGFLKAKGILKIENELHEGLHWHGRGAKTLLLGTRDIWQVLMVVIAFLYLFFK